jgi:hypothetical protein
MGVRLFFSRGEANKTLQNHEKIMYNYFFAAPMRYKNVITKLNLRSVGLLYSAFVDIRSYSFDFIKLFRDRVVTFFNALRFADGAGFIEYYRRPKK